MTAERQGKFIASRERLEEMVTLVQSYRGWSQRRVARALNRNPHAMVPDSGNPKLDLVVTLSKILDWPLEMVVSDLRDAERDAAGERPKPRRSVQDPNAFARKVWALLDAEQWDDVLEITEPEALDEVEFSHRGLLLAYRFQALESTGRYLDAIECCREGLELVARGSLESLRLRGPLAYLLYLVGNFYEAEAMATSLIAELSRELDPLRSDAPNPNVLPHLAMAYFIRGCVLRVHGDHPQGLSEPLLRDAHRSLRTAESLLGSLAIESGPLRNRSIAQTARAAAREVEVLLDDATPSEIVEETLELLSSAEEIGSLDSFAAESLGWCCLIASRVVLQFNERIANSDRVLAILTNKADEVAERLGHWALRERLFTVEHLHRVLAARSGEAPPAWNLDDDDVRTLMGTMGRFPHFRRLGWRILRAVRQERLEPGS